MLKKKGFWISLVVVALIAVGGYFAYNQFYQPTQVVAEEAPLQTAVSRTGDITISATGAGTVIPATEITLSFLTGGVLEELDVQVGSNVDSGDILAKLDDFDAQQAVANADLQLKQAAFSTDAEATGAGVSLSDITVEQARLSLETAQAALDELLNWEPDENEIAQAQANLNAARASYSAAAGSETSAQNNLTIAEIELNTSKRNLQQAQENYDTAWTVDRDWETFWPEPICDPGEPEPCSGQTWQQRIEQERESTVNALFNAQESLTIAQTTFDSTTVGINYSSSASANSNIVSAQISLEEAQIGPSEDEIETAEMAVRQAELVVQQALINQENDALSVKQAQLNLEEAERTLTNTVMLSPMAGTIMSISADVGENVGTAEFITLADLETPLLEVYLDESDMNMVGLDYAVEVVFDALPDETFTGVVVQVDPQLVNESGITAVRALVQLNSFAKPQTLPVGMNATVEVIGGQATNAVIVPVEALRELSPDEYAVFVMENGEPKLRMVQVGIMDFSFAEILSGLEAGEEVTTGIVQTVDSEQ